MENDGLRERAIDSLERQRRFSVLISAYVIGSLVLIAIWGLTGDGYFWLGWPMAAAVAVFAAVGLSRMWSDRSYGEVQIRARAARLSGSAPSGIQR